MNMSINFPHLGIYLEHVGKSISIHGFSIAYYGIIMGCSILLGLYLAEREAKRTGQNPDTYTDLVIYAIVVSIICARTYFLCHLAVVPLFFDPRLPLGKIQKIIELNFSLPGNIDIPVVQQKYSHVCSCTTFGAGCDQSQCCPLTVCELYQIDTSQ